LRTVKHLLDHTQSQLIARGIPNPRLDARILLAHVLQTSHSHLLAYPEQLLNDEQVQQFRALLQRRLAFEPVSRIIGRREFWGLEFNLSPDTLDPRPDSEILVETVLKEIDDRTLPLSLLDLGTGSGCLLLALLHELPQATGRGIDISGGAIKTAQQNAQALNLEQRVQLIQQDWTTGITGQYDWIISNPPYIPSSAIASLAADVRLYDPLQALDGGQDGLRCYQFFAAYLKPLLKLKGKVALEIGQGQEQAVEHLFTDAGFQCLRWMADLSGITRCGLFQIG
jgi:release factor glutamine methyltransferase